MSNQQIKPVQPIVTINAEGHRITTSTNVAEVFDKSHDNVLQSIRNLECSEQFSLLNFQESDYVNSRGKTYQMFEMTERGFSMLAFSFTGKNAMHWKEAFIEVFFRMRQMIEAQMQNKFLTMKSELQDDLLLQNARVYRLSDENGILKDILRKQSQAKARKGTRVTPEENLEIKKLYNKGVCKAEIGRRTGRSPGIINRAINMSVSEAALGARHVH